MMNEQQIEMIRILGAYYKNIYSSRKNFVISLFMMVDALAFGILIIVLKAVVFHREIFQYQLLTFLNGTKKLVVDGP